MVFPQSFHSPGDIIVAPKKERTKEMSKNIIGKKEKREWAVGQVIMIRVDSIVPNPAQPRKFFTDEAILRLADSIRNHGIIPPLWVRRPDNETGGYELVAG